MLRSRVITALLLSALFVGALFALPDLWWALFLLGFILIGAWEWSGLSGFGASGRKAYTAVTCIVGLLLLPGIPELVMLRHWASVALVSAAAVFWLFLAPLWLARRWHMTYRAIAVLMGWLLLFPSWIALIDLRHIGPEAVLMVILAVALADSAAYFSGKRFGKRKLAPEISPGKTWEGLVGALVAVSLFSILLCLWRGWSLWFVVGFLALTILSVMGDLFESMIKRQAGKKDSGSILPGHGGVLDRIDGLTSTLPLVAFYVYLPYFVNLLASR